MAAARIAFAEQGLNASLEGVARKAAVAIGTLYRHFPNRLDLVEELFTAKFLSAPPRGRSHGRRLGGV